VAAATLAEHNLGAVGNAVHQHQAIEGNQKIAFAAPPQFEPPVTGHDTVNYKPGSGHAYLTKPPGDAHHRLTPRDASGTVTADMLP
jgi:hypothetical protein